MHKSIIPNVTGVLYGRFLQLILLIYSKMHYIATTI